MKPYEWDGKIEAGLELRDDEDKRPRTNRIGAEVVAMRLDTLTRTAAPDFGCQVFCWGKKPANLRR